MLLVFSWCGLASGSELDQRMVHWKDRAFLCSEGAGGFPSKAHEKNQGGDAKCDDGDSIMFNALLCRAGVKLGCETIRRSQDADGRFWRSPAKRAARPAEPSSLSKGETTFSGDHAAGLMLYYATTGDRRSFASWVRWIGLNEVATRAPMVGSHRYCENDRCAFRPGDCQILLLLGSRMNVDVPFCTADPTNALPEFTSVAGQLEMIYKEIARSVGIKLTPLRKAASAFRKALAAYEKALGPLASLRTKLHAQVVLSTQMAQIKVSVGALVNEPGFSRHNALVRVLTLEDMGLGRPWTNAISRRVAGWEPQNPFFEFVAHRTERSDRLLTKILNACPDAESDPGNARNQWAWERSTSEAAWVNTMYWDCIFVAELYKSGEKLPSMNQVDLTIAEAHTLLGNRIGDVKKLEKRARNLLEAFRKAASIVAQNPLTQFRDLIRDPKKTTEKKVKAAGKSAKRALSDAKKLVDQVIRVFRF